MMTDFHADIQKGKIGESIFKEEFLDFLGIEYVDVTDCQKFQVIDTDFKAKIGTYEVKSNYKDDRHLIFEDYTNINETLGKVSYGWVYKTSADLIVFVSKETRVLVIVPFTEAFKSHYETIKDDYRLLRNKVSTRKDGGKWQSAFRRLPLDAIRGYYSMYKRIA